MYYCDCVFSHRAKGTKLPKRHVYVENGMYKAHPVDVNRDGCCVHCGHYAYFSKTPVTTIGICGPSPTTEARPEESKVAELKLETPLHMMSEFGDLTGWAT